jgi:hypothetical protein
MRAVSHDWIEMEIRQPAARWEKASAPQEDWRNLIRAASQEEEVIELVRDHIALWSPEEIARLPEFVTHAAVRLSELKAELPQDIA